MKVLYIIICLAYAYYMGNIAYRNYKHNKKYLEKVSTLDESYLESGKAIPEYFSVAKYEKKMTKHTEIIVFGLVLILSLIPLVLCTMEIMVVAVDLIYITLKTIIMIAAIGVVYNGIRMMCLRTGKQKNITPAIVSATVLLIAGLFLAVIEFSNAKEILVIAGKIRLSPYFVIAASACSIFLIMVVNNAYRNFVFEKAIQKNIKR